MLIEGPVEYRQLITRYEDGFGATTIYIKLAGQYNDLFVASGQWINCITLEQVENILENEQGKFAQNELIFSINESSISIDDKLEYSTSQLTADYPGGLYTAGLPVSNITRSAPAIITITNHGFYTGQKIAFTGTTGDNNWDKAFANRVFEVVVIDNDIFTLLVTPITYLRDALSQQNKRYIAVFIDVPEDAISLNISQAIFIGIVNPEEDSDDLLWRGGQWQSNVKPLSKYRYRAATTYDAWFDDIDLKDLIDGNNQLDIPGIDTEWESYHVEDRPGWFLDQSRSIRVHKIVSLNRLLRKLADNLEVALLRVHGVVIHITFDGCELDGQWLPARWSHPENPPHEPRYCATSYKTNTVPFLYSLYKDDAIKLELNPEGPPLMFHDIWINYARIKPQINEFDSGLAKEYLWTRHFRTFTDVLYQLAKDLNIYVNFIYDGTNLLRIKFTTRSQIPASRIYIRDVISSKTLRSLPEQNDQQKIAVDAFYYAEDGNSLYKVYQRPYYLISTSIVYKTVVERYPIHDISKPQHRTKAPCIVSISPTVASIQPAADDNYDYDWAYLPHNHYFTMNNNPQMGYHQQTIAVHTGMYMYVKKHTITNGYEEDHYGSNRENNYYWTPVARLIIKLDNTEKEFKSLTDYSNSLIERDINYYNIEKEVEVPYWHGFSANANGNNPSALVLQLGSKIIIDNIEYVLVRKTIYFDKILTKLALKALTRFDGISDSQDPVTSSIPEPNEIESEIVDSPPIIADYIAHGNIYKYQYVSWYAVGKKVEFSRADDSHYSRLAGFALNDAADSEQVLVQSSGKLTIPGIGNNIGKQLFIRNISNNVNISFDWPNDKSKGNMYAYVARIVDEDTIEIIQPAIMVLE